jgi:hypothetical protein
MLDVLLVNPGHIVLDFDYGSFLTPQGFLLCAFVLAHLRTLVPPQPPGSFGAWALGVIDKIAANYGHASNGGTVVLHVDPSLGNVSVVPPPSAGN